MKKDNGTFPAFNRLILALLLVSTALCANSWGEVSLEKRVKEYRLDNGMRILVLRRSGSPTFSAYIRFLVGGVDENRGESGVAHILEHMLFKGSERIGTSDFAKEKVLMEAVERTGAEYDREKRKGDKADAAKLTALKEQLKKEMDAQREFIKEDEISEIYQRNGGSGFNAFTAKDTTTYLIKLPANKFELWAWMESDRLRSPVLREYYSERDVIMEERRRSVDNSPDGRLYEQFMAAAFPAHPYGVPVIGWETDIDYMPLDDVKSFLKTYYSPNNMVACIVGDLDPDQVYQTMKEYFGDIPPQAIPPRIATVEPPQDGERRIEVEFDANPQVMIGFHKPALPHRDDYVFDVINTILAEGRTSRLYKSLVLEKGLVADIGAYEVPGMRYPNLYIIQAIPRAPHTIAEVEQAVYAELERLKTEPLTPREMQKVVNNMEADFIRKLQSNSGLAHYLSEYQIIFDDWRWLERYGEELKKVTPENVMAAAKKYFVKSNRTVATLTQLKKAEPK
ncbi:MAG: insulinase family protein [Nitrospinae bacterium]|nr:insulinase family protein [Nitrospinota bacterium]